MDLQSNKKYILFCLTPLPPSTILADPPPPIDPYVLNGWSLNWDINGLRIRIIGEFKLGQGVRAKRAEETLKHQ